MNLLLSRSSRRESRLWAGSGRFFYHSSALWGSVYLDGRVGIIHRSACKVNSANFRFTEFSEVRRHGDLESSYVTPQLPRPSGWEEAASWPYSSRSCSIQSLS